MSTETPTIPAETANHVLFHYGRGGYQAGTFTQLLIQTIDHADVINQDKLALRLRRLRRRRPRHPVRPQRHRQPPAHRGRRAGG